MTDISALEAYAGDLSEAAAKSKAASKLQHDYINGDENTDVPTESGPLPALLKQARLYRESLPEAVADLSAQMANGRFYDTFAEGRLATAVNQYFWVTPAGSGLPRVSAFKKLSATDQVFAFSYAEGSELDAVVRKSESVDDIAHTFEDGHGFILGGISVTRQLTMKGGVDVGAGQFVEGQDGFELSDANRFTIATLGVKESLVSGLRVERISADQSSVNGLVLTQTANPGIEITDEHGFIVARYDNSAPYEVNTLSAAVASSAGRLDMQQRTDVMHIIGYGQSLKRGINSTPAISTTQPYFNIMFASGVKTRAGEAGYNPGSFVQLIEQTVSTEGETPVTGMCNGIVRRAVADGEVASNWVFLATAPGRSGRAVEQLMPSDDPLADFNKMVQQVRDAKARCDALGKSYSVWAVTWAQGESNYVGAYTRSPYQYMQYMMNLFDTLSAKIMEISGQQFLPYIFTYQVGAHRKYNVDNMSIALSQWRASRERPDVVMAVPVYMFPTGEDSLHLTNESSWLFGEYQSRAAYQTMVRRSGKWRPLEPVSVDWQADHIDIKFHVPSGSLVLDAALCVAEINQGFDIRENNVIAEIITSVSVIGVDVVRIAISRPTTSAAVLSYARGRNTGFAGSGPTQGARGNLRDTAGLYDTAVSPLGNTFALHNPCVMFQYDRRTGF